MADANTLIQKGIAAIRQQDRAGAQQAFRSALKLEPGNVVAWLWLSKTVNDPSKQREVLRRGLQATDNHEQLQTALDNIGTPAPDIPPDPRRKLISGKPMGLYLIIGWLWVAIFAVTAFYAVRLIPQSTQTYDGQFNLINLLFMIGCVLVMVALVVALGRRLLTLWRATIELYEGGVKLVHLGNVRVPWADVAAIKFAKVRMPLVYRLTPIVLYRNTNFTLELADGRRTSISSIYSNYQQLLETALAKSAPIFAERDAARLQKGEEIHYGNITATAAGLQRGRKQFAWHEIVDVEERPGFYRDVRILSVSGEDMYTGIYDAWNGHVIGPLVRYMQLHRGW